MSGLKLNILARPSLSSSHASRLIQVMRRTPELWFQQQRPWFPTCDAMWSTLGKVTPLAETYTFSHFPTRIPNNFTDSVLFLKRLRSVLMQPWTYLHKSAKVNTGLVVKWRLFGTWCKERRVFVVALSECFLSWLLTTGANKGSLWEDRSVPSVSDVFMPGWGNWMAAECSHAGPSHPNQRRFF